MVSNIYTVGGTVQAGDGIYIPRLADHELLHLCRTATFSYILAPHQIGKSSLLVRTAQQLASEGIKSVIIDLNQIGTYLTAEQWYLGLLTTIGEQINLITDEVDWWRKRKYLGRPQRLTLFFQEVLMREVPVQLVIFVDEIDATLNLDFADDFFDAMRFLHNNRASVPELRRLSFVLSGSLMPGELIRDTRRTPFNIVKWLDLDDWNFVEALPLMGGLNLPMEQAQQVLGLILEWTRGHPYLTQRLCCAMATAGHTNWTESTVKAVVDETFFGVASDQDTHLQFVRDMLTRCAPDSHKSAVLETYYAVLRGRQVKDDEVSAAKLHLKLSGVLRRDGGFLRVRNPIYSIVFDEGWVQEHTPAKRTKQQHGTVVSSNSLNSGGALALRNDINQQQELLTTYREALKIYLEQLAKQSAAFATPVLFHNIDEARKQIRRIKLRLRKQGIKVDDFFIDND